MGSSPISSFSPGGGVSPWVFFAGNGWLPWGFGLRSASALMVGFRFRVAFGVCILGRSFPLFLADLLSSLRECH